MQIVVNGSLSEEMQDRCIRLVTEKVPIGLIEKLYLDAEEDEVNISYTLRKISEKRKMSGCCIGSPEDWNIAKQAEQKETIPNRIV